MDAGELLGLFRAEMNDVAAPYLWSDDFIYGAIDDAQKQFTRKTHGIPDSTTPLVDLALTTVTDVYKLSPLILKVRSARRADNGRPLEVINEEDMPQRGWYFDGIPGVVKALILGMDTDSVRCWPVPIADTAVKLSVFRLPLLDSSDSGEFEIATQHHRHLLMWAKHLAYGVQDAETFDKTRARDFKDAFEAYCFNVKTEQDRARHKPRSVSYGGL
jgi:hypothetical protein